MAHPVTPPFERTSSFPASIATEVPSGPLSGPSDTTWRRQRLLHIGSVQSIFSEQDPQDTPAESTPIFHHRPPMKKSHSSYGTIPHDNPKKPGFAMRHGLPELPVLGLPGNIVSSASSSPTQQRYGTLDRPSIFRSQRPISAYDAPFRGRPEERDL